MSDKNGSDTKVALVTGANRGIGFETARELGELGIRVILGSRDLELGRKAAAELAAKGIAAEAVRLDIANPADHVAVAAYIGEKYGKLDILVNNAAINERSNTCLVYNPLLKDIFEINFFKTVELTQVLLPLVRKSPAGRIVNVSSVMGSLTMHADPKSRIYAFKNFSYDASKTALNAFTIHLAFELRDTKIKVNSADPGWVKTAMGGPNAPLELSEGGKSSVRLATLPDDGPTCGFFKIAEALPW
jgi:NAD(P)-dependent dehydrogenase (short-subunit alcohol dehydrogenase family)